jgi:membrane protein implicated in regulation of membrane protease activity
MLGFTFANMVFYLICIGLLWKEGNYLNFIGEMVVLWISAIVILIFTFLVLYLIGFHIYLYCICMTTYDFLKRKKKNKEKLGDSLQNIL